MTHSMEQKEQLPPKTVKQKDRSWLNRNWKWFVPVGCFAFLALWIGFILLLFYFVFSLGKSSDVYKEALARVQENPAVIGSVGKPITAGWYITGSITISDSSGTADIQVPVAGPEGKATLYVVATKSSGTWTYSTLVVEIRKNGHRIDLLEKPI